jgi:hypothetical protein
MTDGSDLYFRAAMILTLSRDAPLLAELTVCGACDGTTFRLYYLPLHGHVHYECVPCGTVHCPGARCPPAEAVPPSD